jgi:hypothetical protein
MLGIMCVHLDERILITRRVAEYTWHLRLVCHGSPAPAKNGSPLERSAETIRSLNVLNTSITICSRARGGKFSPPARTRRALSIITRRASAVVGAGVTAVTRSTPPPAETFGRFGVSKLVG